MSVPASTSGNTLNSPQSGQPRKALYLAVAVSELMNRFILFIVNEQAVKMVRFSRLAVRGYHSSVFS